MTSHTTNPDSAQPVDEVTSRLFANWIDPIETEVRARAREFIEELIRGELDAALARPRYGRGQKAGDEASARVAGHRHGSRTRLLTGTFGPVEIEIPRARLRGARLWTITVATFKSETYRFLRLVRPTDEEPPKERKHRQGVLRRNGSSSPFPSSWSRSKPSAASAGSNGRSCANAMRRSIAVSTRAAAAGACFGRAT